MSKKKVPSPVVDAQARPNASQMVRANVNREVITAPTFASLYANDTQVETTPWDIRLVFGEISESPTVDRPRVVVKQVGEVRMSPQHAKRITQILVKQLEHYEKTLGHIPLPED